MHVAPWVFSTTFIYFDPLTSTFIHFQPIAYTHLFFETLFVASQFLTAFLFNTVFDCTWLYLALTWSDSDHCLVLFNAQSFQ